MAAFQEAVVGFSWPSATDLSKQEQRVRLSPSAIRGIFKIARHWKLRDEDFRLLLGGMPSSTFYALKSHPAKTLDTDRLTRISLLIGIYKALHILYSERLANAWVLRSNANPMFSGDSPLSYMQKGGIPALLRVRQLLDARRGGR